LYNLTLELAVSFAHLCRDAVSRAGNNAALEVAMGPAHVAYTTWGRGATGEVRTYS